MGPRTSKPEPMPGPALKPLAVDAATGPTSSKPYYPAFLDLAGRRCVVIGGGTVAQRKVQQLLAAAADVVVVAPEATQRLVAQARAMAIHWEARAYAPGDLAGALLAIAATDDPDLNERVRAEASAARVLLNVADAPALCDFIAPAVVERGAVTVAISSHGKSPALARKLREQMGSRGCHCLRWAAAAEVLSAVREQLRSEGRVVAPETWQTAMDDGVLALVLAGDPQGAMRRLRDRLIEPDA